MLEIRVSVEELEKPLVDSLSLITDEIVTDSPELRIANENARLDTKVELDSLVSLDSSVIPVLELCLIDLEDCSVLEMIREGS